MSPFPFPFNLPSHFLFSLSFPVGYFLYLSIFFSFSYISSSSFFPYIFNFFCSFFLFFNLNRFLCISLLYCLFLFQHSISPFLSLLLFIYLFQSLRFPLYSFCPFHLFFRFFFKFLHSVFFHNIFISVAQSLRSFLSFPNPYFI